MADDRYRRLDRIGAGPTAEVYRAVDTATDRLVALKLLAPALHDDPVALERLQRDLAVAREIDHPAVVPIELLPRRDGALCLVMPFVAGATLHEHLERHHPLDPAAAVALLRQLLSALAACHARQLLHRDLKPNNVIVASDASVSILDFGVAQLSGRGDPARVALAGLDAPPYVAPEQRAGGLPDARGDLYAVGVMAFELLAGRLPEMHGAASAPRRGAELAACRRGLPPWLPLWVERLSDERCAARYQTADDALHDLAQRRVVAAELPELPRRRCPRCGEQTLRRSTACLVCGWDAPRMLTPGERDVWRGDAADPARLAAYGEELLGVRLRARGPRLLLAGIDDDAADVVCRGAAARALPLEVRPRSPWAELRAAVPLAAACLIGRGIVEHAQSRWDYYGPYFFDQVTTLQAMQFIAPAVLFAICARNVRREAVVPAWPLPHPADDQPPAVLLTPGRGAAWHAIGLRLAERLALLERDGRHTDAEWMRTLRELAAAAARLIAPLSDVDARLTAPPLLLHLHDCAAALRAGGDEASALQTLRAYYGAVDRATAARLQLCAADAHLAQAAGRVLVLHQTLDAATQANGAACVQALTAALDDLCALQRELAELP